MSEARWSVHHLQGTEAGEMRTLFGEVFGHAMPAALWEWKYRGGRGHAMVARDRAGHMVGHYGGMVRTVHMLGQPGQAIQIGDVMVAQHERGVLTRSGPLSMLSAAFFGAHVGPQRPYVLGFGFPSLRHLRVGERLGQYTAVDTVQELHWPLPAPERLAWWHEVAPLDPQRPADAAVLDGLWLRQRAASAQWMLPQRDAAWWRYRLGGHPTHRYQCHLVRLRGLRRPVGALALRPSDAPGGSWELMDWIAHPGDVPTLLRAARQVASAAGATRLHGWFSSTVAGLLHTPDCTVHDIGVHVPIASCSGGPPAQQQQGRWWLTGADTDFR